MPWRHRERVDILLARHEMTAQQAVAADALNDSDYAKYKNAYVYGNLIHLHGTGAPSGPIHCGFDNTALDRQPGIDVEVGGRTVEAALGDAEHVAIGSGAGNGGRPGEQEP